MATWAELLAELRDCLEDNPTDPLKAKYTDAELLSYCRDAYRDFSGRLPRHTRMTLAVVASQDTYTLDPSVMRIQALEMDGETLVEIKFQPGVELYEDREGYMIYDRNLVLYPTPVEASTATLHVACSYIPPTTGTDILTIPDAGLLAIKYFMWHRGMHKDEIKRARLAQWENSKNNPLAPVASMLLKLYLDQIVFLDGVDNIQLSR